MVKASDYLINLSTQHKNAKRGPSSWPVETGSVSVDPTARENVKKKALSCNALFIVKSDHCVAEANVSEYTDDVYADIRI